MTKFKSILRIWIPIAVASSFLSAVIYLTVQQNYRQNVNDPQIQMAEDLALLLQNGKSPQDIIGQTQVDLNKSLQTFIIIYNELGKPLVSQAVLDGRIPTPPVGVFTYTREKKEDRLTWEPKVGVREAAVLVRFDGANPGYVLVGRSLREVEQRESQLTMHVGLGLLATLIGSLIATFFLQGV